jgi:hypothetical protein
VLPDEAAEQGTLLGLCVVTFSDWLGELDAELEALLWLAPGPDSLYPAHVRRLDVGSVRAERAQLVADLGRYLVRRGREDAPLMLLERFRPDRDDVSRPLTQPR